MENIYKKHDKLYFKLIETPFPFKIKEICAVKVTDYGDIDIYKDSGIVTIPMGELSPYADKIFARISKLLKEEKGFISTTNRTVINANLINGFANYMSENKYNVDINFSNRKLNFQFEDQSEMQQLVNNLNNLIETEEKHI